MGVSITRYVKFIRKGERGNSVINAVTSIRRNTLATWQRIGATNYAFVWVNISNYADMKIGDTMVIQGVVTDKDDISVTYYGTITAINTTSVQTIATALIMSGTNGSSFAAQYSVDGSTNWHNTFTDGDIYMRTSADGGKTWSAAIKIVGEKGGETNYQFAWSSHKTLDDSENPLSDVVDWYDYPPAQTDASKPYLWTMITTPDNKVSYARLTGEKGDKGERGPALRGPQAWSDCAVGYVFQSGASGEEYKDIVLYGNNYYSCIKSHTKTESNNPGSATDTNSGLWKLADKLEMVATKILLAQYALVKNLGVETIDMKDADGNIIFQAKDGNVTCNSGTFKNITVKGNSSFEGSVKANMFYGTVKKVTPGSTYTIDPVNEPYNFYYVENPTKRTFIVLPKAANYEGLEINIFTKSLPSSSLSYRTIVVAQANDDLYVKQNAAIVSSNTAVEKINVEYTNFKNDSITTAFDSYIRFKCIGGAWYAISGQFTGE